jgi:hypothetical protein
MTTSPSSAPQRPTAQPLEPNPQGAAQVEAERKRLGITEADLERSRRDSV